MIHKQNLKHEAMHSIGLCSNNICYVYYYLLLVLLLLISVSVALLKRRVVSHPVFPLRCEKNNNAHHCTIPPRPRLKIKTFVLSFANSQKTSPLSPFPSVYFHAPDATSSPMPRSQVGTLQKNSIFFFYFHSSKIILFVDRLDTWFL